ncbi:2,3-diaminopropionate biosynthesis protein SbnA [Nocardia macrotermitis]|uniref:N-(2-amino-2-carboxyethyl)-L-glutamate synthase n=1 Tax=Nocardia macrotermitis TaxID=2585198 RepID=A0A7K0D3A3_9NOCA|nr:2,3-diaminopropionate biosynthesis protein SbnA [Nocardia macrotermitis]MQY20206.1 putative siderophore biosynthesis protein SbnA [Nocardia macrotermitis]
MIESEQGILDAIGTTPIIRLKKLFPDTTGLRVFAKLEGLNPGGSIKDRPAVNMVQRAVDSGILVPGTSTLVESSSGNLGIGLAQVCAYLGIGFICIADTRTSPQNIKIMRALGADVRIVDRPDPVTGELLTARKELVHRLVAAIPGAVSLDQYANPSNPQAHHTTMHEIVAWLGEEIDFVVCATGTVGTLRGCADFIAAHGMRTKLVAVDAVGSVIFGQPSLPRLIPGHGASERPAHFTERLADHVVHVSDADCVEGCRRLAVTEAVLAGGSSGGITVAAQRFLSTLTAAATCVLILPDRGERYLDTIYDDGWVGRNITAHQLAEHPN